jgi:hypothetical protein
MLAFQDRLLGSLRQSGGSAPCRDGSADNDSSADNLEPAPLTPNVMAWGTDFGGSYWMAPVQPLLNNINCRGWESLECWPRDEMHKSIMLGPLRPEEHLSMSEVAEVMKGVLGFSLDFLPERQTYYGGTEEERAWLTEYRSPDEPFRSHPFDLEFTTAEPEEAPSVALFERLAGLGRYRLILMHDDDCVRATHFDCDDWWLP